MADNPSFIPNSYQTPNAYCDRLLYLLTPAEWKVLSYAVRRIFGFQKRQDRISLSQFVHGTVSLMDGEHLDHGTGLSKPTVIACLGALIQYRLIIKLADSNPSKKDGDLYALQLEYDKVDYSGLVDRANNRAQDDAQRTVSGRNSAASKRLSLPLIGQSDLPVGPVNGIDQYWSMGLTGTGQWDLPVLVNGIDTQYTDGNPEEIKGEGISSKDFARACAFLRESRPADYAAAAPVLLRSDEHPNRMTVKLAGVPPGFMDAFKTALAQASHKAWTVSFETPATGQAHPQPPAPAPATRRDNGHTQPDASVTRSLPGCASLTPEQAWQAAQGELQLEMTRATYETWVKPAVLISVNGAWKIGVPNKTAQEWLQQRLLSTVRRVLNGIVGAPVTIEFVVMK